MRCLVTGGAGFIGSHTVRALHAAGHAVRLLVRDRDKVQRVYAGRGFVPSDLVAGDVADAASVAEAMRGCDAVFHAAALVDLRRKLAPGVIRTVRGVGYMMPADGGVAAGE